MKCKFCKDRGWHVNTLTRQKEPCPQCKKQSKFADMSYTIRGKKKSQSFDEE